MELGPPGDVDLPAPKVAARGSADGDRDLLVPVESFELGLAGSNDDAELPAPIGMVRPRRPQSSGDDDLPAPVRPGMDRGASSGQAGISIDDDDPRGAPLGDGFELGFAGDEDVAPVPPAGRKRLGNVSDLPAPATGRSRGADSGEDLLMAPVGSTGTRSPKSAPMEAPVQTRKPMAAGAELPVPKSKPAATAELPVPKSKPAATAELPAPKSGFFDDLAPEAGNALDLPAPKGGFFDDIPGPAAANALDLPAPKDRFSSSADTLELSSLGLDLDALPAPAAVQPGSGSPAQSAGMDFDPDSAGFELGVSYNDGATGAEAGDGSEESRLTLDFDGLELAESTSQAPSYEALPMGLGLPDKPVNVPARAPLVSQPATPAPRPATPAPRPVTAAPLPAVTAEEEAPSWMDALESSPLIDLGSFDSQMGLSEPAGLELGQGQGTPSPASSPPSPIAASPEAPASDSYDDLDTSGMDLGLELGPPPSSAPVAPIQPRTQPKPQPRPAAAPAAADQLGLELSRPASNEAEGDIGLALELPRSGGTIAGGASDYDQLDLGSGSVPASAPGVVTFNKSAAGKPSDIKANPSSGLGKAEPAKAGRPSLLDRLRNQQKESDEPLVIDDGAMLRAAQPKGTVAARVMEKRAQEARTRRNRIIAVVAVLMVGGLGVAGFTGYQRWQEEKGRNAAVQQSMETARKQLLSDRAGHWERAAKTAEDALSINPRSPDALGVAAQGYYAAFIEEGTDMSRRLAAGNRHMKAVLEVSAKGPEVEKAHALKLITERRPDDAVDRLNGILDVDASDPNALLYLGWAHAAANHHDKAVRAFQQAVKATPERQIPAHFGLGQALLAMGQRDAARDSFEAILKLEKDHLGALVGVAEAAALEQSSSRETRYLAILARDDLDKADPRVLSHAWMLAGAQALRASRLDEAKLRFDKAREIYRDSLDARIGQAKVALAQGRLDAAEEPLKEVLTASPGHIDGTLTAAELALRQGKLAPSEELLGELLAREQSIPNQLDRARIHLLKGRILENRAEAAGTGMDEAIAAYKEAVELGGADDIQPAVALARLFTKLDRNQEAQAILGPVESKAGADPALAVTLGLLYASAESPAKAETWFRKALELQPNDIEAQYQLGLALREQSRSSEALAALAQAFQADETRADIGLELAIMYEGLARDSDAAQIYEKLQAAPAPSLNVLGRAGRFFARTGDLERAGQLGERILADQVDNPAGRYLRGEGRYHAGDYDSALRDFRDAVLADPNPQYLEAQGRTAEKLKGYDEALKAYTQANAVDKRLLAPLIGQARVRIARRDFDKALLVLEEARALAPEDARIHFNIGRCYHEQGDLKEAVEHYKRSLRYDSQSAVTHYELGQAYFDLDKQRNAAAELTKATRLAKKGDPWLSDAYLDLGYAERSLSHRSEAIAAWEAYLDGNPTNEAEVTEVKRLLLRLKAR